MTNNTLTLTAGLDRSRAWEEGGSVRYLVAELAAEGVTTPRTEAPALNLALAIDVSGSMADDKVNAARRAARAVAEALSLCSRAAQALRVSASLRSRISAHGEQQRVMKDALLSHRMRSVYRRGKKIAIPTCGPDAACYIEANKIEGI